MIPSYLIFDKHLEMASKDNNASNIIIGRKIDARSPNFAKIRKVRHPSYTLYMN